MTDSAAEIHCDHAIVAGVVADDVLITVRGGRFDEVHTGVERPPGATRLDGLTVPGLANAHSHAFHRALRSRTQADRGSFWTWRELMYSVAGRLDPDSYHRLARAVFAEMALAGVTTVGEFHYVHHQPDGRPYGDPNAMGLAVFAAAQEAGIRITLLDTCYQHGGLGPDGYVEPSHQQRRFCDPSPEAWVERVEALEPGPNALVGAAIHSVRAVDPEGMARVADWARDRGRPLHVHVSEQQAENEQCRHRHGHSPTIILDRVGALGSHVTAVHATHVDANDRARLSASGTVVCLCPTTERDLGDGIGPSADLVAGGIALALGSDSHAVIDLFEESRALELDQRLRSETRGVHSARELLEAATVNGHRSLGWPDIGTITAGQRADLVAVDVNSVRTAGAPPGHEAAVFAATASDVTDVMVDGRWVVRDRNHCHIDAAGELNGSIRALFGS